jgi:hypothetical protein
MRRSAAAAAAAALGAGIVGGLLLVDGGDRKLPPLPAPPAPALVVGTPARLAEAPPAGRWTTVVRTALARAAPTALGPVVASLDARTAEGSDTVVLVQGRTVDASGTVWVRVSIPGPPGRTSAWVPRHALGGYHDVETRLVVDRESLTATLLRDGRAVLRAPVGVGRPEFPTPVGRYYVTSRLTAFGTPFYGPLAFATSARSGVLTDWPGGGVIGIHGTDRPDLVPGRISHGCIRLRNRDIVRLARLMPIGTPVTIT